MQKTEKLNPIVKSPARDAHLRKGRGFSLLEIQSANMDINTLKKLNIKIDFNRRTKHTENIELLKNLEITMPKGKKREPFVKSEKKRTGYKPKTQKKKSPKKPQTKKKVIKEEKIKRKKGVEPEKEVERGTSLEELPGLGPATAKKFNELGVQSIEDLMKEKPEELAPLIKGCSEDRLKKWIEEGKELIKK